MLTSALLEQVRRGLKDRTAADLVVEPVGRDRPKCVLLSLAHVDARESFVLEAEYGYQRLEVTCRMGPFAGPLLTAMCAASPGEKVAFTRLAEAAERSGGRVELRINGSLVSPTDAAVWPDDWRSFDFCLTKVPVNVEGMAPEERAHTLEIWGALAFLMVVALAAAEPTDQTEELSGRETGSPEGARSSVLANRYERSNTNRLRCIAIHGTCCAACGIDLGKTYGELGSGFIHVHHVTPVSLIGEGYVVDPATDLVPVCPNCHAMLHRRSPPLQVKELRSILKI